MKTSRLTIFVNELNSFYYIPRKSFNWSIETVAWQFNKWQIRFCFWKDYKEYATKQHRKTPIGLLRPPSHIYFILLSKIITQFVPVEIKIILFFPEEIVKEKRQLLLTLNNEIFFLCVYHWNTSFHFHKDQNKFTINQYVDLHILCLYTSHAI